VKETKNSDYLIKTVHQAKRLIKIVIGFTILILGLVMLITPGPGVVTIIIGLAILGTEFLWARRLMRRFEKEASSMKDSFIKNIIKK